MFSSLDTTVLSRSWKARCFFSCQAPHHTAILRFKGREIRDGRICAHSVIINAAGNGQAVMQAVVQLHGPRLERHTTRAEAREMVSAPAAPKRRFSGRLPWGTFASPPDRASA